MAQLGRFKSMMTWHRAHPRPQKYGRKGIMTARALRLKGIPCPAVHRTPLPALPSLGITRFFLGIRKGDWEGLFLWKIIIFVCRYLPVVAKGLLLRKELWSHLSFFPALVVLQAPICQQLPCTGGEQQKLQSWDVFPFFASGWNEDMPRDMSSLMTLTLAPHPTPSGKRPGSCCALALWTSTRREKSLGKASVRALTELKRRRIGKRSCQ